MSAVSSWLPMGMLGMGSFVLAWLRLVRMSRNVVWSVSDAIWAVLGSLLPLFSQIFGNGSSAKPVSFWAHMEPV
jgi:hypothetical protein